MTPFLWIMRGGILMSLCAMIGGVTAILKSETLERLLPLGAVVAYALSQNLHVAGLVLFGADNFIYIAASDLIPEIKSQSRLKQAVLQFGVFLLGVVLMGVLAYGVKGGGGR